MKQSYARNLFILMAMSIALQLGSCSKSKEETGNTTPQKSLNKSTITPKKWYSEGSVFIHDFKAGGVYNQTGTWTWVNNSDTMEIVSQSGYSPTKWKMYWNTDKEMECEKIGTFTKLLYKDVVW